MVETQIKLCECGCGLPAPIAARNWHKKGVKKGQSLRFVCGHHRRGKMQSRAEKIKRVKSWGVNDAAISPYLPDHKVIRYHLDQKRWYCAISGVKKPHARAVYEHCFGQIPEGMVVHHKSGKADQIEDDRPDNLMLISKQWNLHYLPQLAKGFDVSEKVVTDFYCEVVNQVDESIIFQEVCRKLLNYKDGQC